MELTGPLGDELWWIDNQLYTLPRRREEVVRQLRAAAGATRERSGPAMPDLGAFAPPPAAPGRPDPPLPPPPPTSWPTPGAAVGTRPAGPEVSSILLALGVGLLVVAALVFAVVSWDRLGALGQGAVLVGLTLAAGWGTRAAKRSLSGTAEALGVLTVLMGPLLAQAVRITLDLPGLDDLSWANWVAWSWWPGVLALVGVAAIAFGRWVGIRSAPSIGVVLVQVTPVAWLVLSPLPAALVAIALAAQAAVVGAGPTRGEREGAAADLWAIGAVVAWLVALVVAIGSAPTVHVGAGQRWGAVAALAACAGVAAASLRRRPLDLPAEALVAAAALPAYLAVARALGGLVADVAFWPLLGLVAVVGLAIATRLDPGRGRALAAVSWVVVAVAAIPAADAVASVVGLAGSADEPWRGDRSATVEAVTGLGLDPAWLSLVAGSVVLALAGWVDRSRVRAADATRAAWALAAVTILALPVVVGVSLGMAIAAALVVAVVAAALAWWSDDVVPGTVAALGGLALAVAWAAPEPSLLLAPGAVAFGLGAAAVAAGVRRSTPRLAGAGAGLAVVAVVADAALLAARSGASPAWTWAVASIAATAIAPLASWTAPPRPVASPETGALPELAAGAVAGQVAEAAAIGLHLAAAVGLVAAAGEIAELAPPGTAALVAGVVGFAILAARQLPGEVGWLSAGLSALELLGVVWLRLADAQVGVPEAYTLPVAALLGVAGWAAGHRDRVGLAVLPSWLVEGPALAMALGPTALIALGDPGLTRQLVGLATGALALGAGAAWRRRAPVDVGAVVLVVVGLQALLPYADDVPRWLSLGLAGAVLVALGATFEQRRRDLGQARRRYAALR